MSNGFSLTQTYRIPSTGFQIEYDIQSLGLNGVIEPKDINFLWNHRFNRAENNLEDSRYNCNVRYYETSGDYDELAERSNDFEEETLGNPLKWVSFKQKFFTSAVIANSAFKSGYVTTIADLGDTTTVKNGIHAIGYSLHRISKWIWIQLLFRSKQLCCSEKSNSGI